MLWAPNRPPRLLYASTGGIGQVEIGTGCLSSRASRTHTSFGQSEALSVVDSSVTISRLRLNMGTTVWVKPVYGGELSHWQTGFGCALSEMSSTNMPASI